MADLYPVFSDLVRFETDLWNAVDERLRREADVTLGRFEAMRVVDAVASCRVADVAKDLSITVGGASKLVDRVEASRHCRRRGDPTDRRSSVIELTAAGTEKLAECARVVEDELGTRMGQVLSPRALTAFAHTLTNLRKNT
ncbi:MarR family winged helix-turn-helix transcriptional regulator [Actinomycetes bacterium M1A6_2h]